MFIAGVILTAIGATLALVTDGWLGLLFESAAFPHAIAGTIATLAREIAMTLGLVLVGVSLLARVLEPSVPS
ncbi:hypothetical protein [Herbiconiux sp. A18JL235]|uniref:DUF998 domain-containing protein n=1 Tax=Herbiconiux sp. A18JL235 TaxID=3152363 RepID=A0AB39BD72_9MICO